VTHPLAFVKIYAVQNKEGKFFRAKGYGGSGESWTDDVKKARLYLKQAPASRTVSYFAEHWPEFGVPSLVELSVGEVKILDQTAVHEKRQQVKKKRADKQEALRAEWQKKYNELGPRP
jgi:hypothetical protein